jgi:hypothetical protein
MDMVRFLSEPLHILHQFKMTAFFRDLREAEPQPATHSQRGRWERGESQMISLVVRPQRAKSKILQHSLQTNYILPLAGKY